ncbi:MAG TPA: hypothetical protein VKC66_17815 [Xanthobacteraceae bacterium]|nr:hypothetical protein [Xanthobacteraceae bacterium]
MPIIKMAARSELAKVADKLSWLLSGILSYGLDFRSSKSLSVTSRAMELMSWENLDPERLGGLEDFNSSRRAHTQGSGTPATRIC